MRGERQDRRWQLNRAGIVNVYQYEHEVIDFHGGRLLLRGVNGSGKSTAMNMLLPFLVTARASRIDAAGEQTGVLRSWMLTGRDDAQPVGYLWIEFSCGDRYLTCGCGIKANRQSDNVTTWWFVSDRRPEIDFDVVDGNVPLSAEALRAVLDGPHDEVFNERGRPDYRRAVEQRLFGGARIDQHVDLLNVVRNPRIGDRIDVDLPSHLVDALPHLSEQALAEAAQPLDDLETHRRNVDELARTRDAITGLLDVYRPYAIDQLWQRVESGRATLDAQRSARRAESKAEQDRAAAVTHHVATLAERDRVDAETARLMAEISAIKDTDLYREARQLDDLRTRARTAEGELAAAGCEVERAASAAAAAATAANVAGDQLATDRKAFTDHTGAMIREGLRLHVECPPWPEFDVAPHRPVDPDPVHRALGALAAGIGRRHHDIADTRVRLDRVEAADRALARVGDSLAAAQARHAAAVERLAASHTAAASAVIAWRAAYIEWGERFVAAVQTADDPAIHTVSGDRSSVPEALHQQGVERLAAQRAAAERVLAAAEHELALAEGEQRARQARLDELDRRREPEMPHATWQRSEPTRLADLIDFHPHVTADDRAGLEAALEASGLLTARLAGDGGVALADGELVVIAPSGVAQPADSLAGLLAATVPADAAVSSADVDRLLAAIATDGSAATATAVISPSGEFRLGVLRGRHLKPEAEYVGATAKRAALERARDEARRQLAEQAALVAQRVAEDDHARADAATIESAAAALPGLGEVVAARVAVHHATELEAEDAAALADRQADVDEHERRVAALADEMHRVAATLRLPVDRSSLTTFADDLDELRNAHTTATHRLDTVLRSHVAAGTARQVAGDAASIEQRAVSERQAREVAVDELNTRLATIEDALGSGIAELMASLEISQADLGRSQERQRQLIDELQAAAARAATALTQSEYATAERLGADQRCDRERVELIDVVRLPGLLTAAIRDHQPAESAVVGSAESGAEGLAELTGQLVAALPPAPAQAGDADSVRMSLRQRRDSIGAGWDAEARQPDPTRPLIVEIHGPTGRGTLVDQHAVIAERFEQTSNLLTRKQDDALRGLLQGQIARELAVKVDEARRLVDLMNARLSAVRTSHDVGVELRWRRSPDLDEATTRLVELLSTVPDLRRTEDDDELRTLLAARLDDARREHPELPYRQLIGATLDYRQWHEMAVLLHRGRDQPARLRRATPLSEGEKKLVTYLPMFAAVAASYDAFDAPPPGEPGPARFLLLDDAFAKVSEDNHAKLFGLIVELDLDLIATSERLWGTHRSVPALAITEVVRDASNGVILLEHYRWDGSVLERVNSAAAEH